MAKSICDGCGNIEKDNPLGLKPPVNAWACQGCAQILARRVAKLERLIVKAHAFAEEADTISDEYAPLYDEAEKIVKRGAK
jgi:hypothetical protein